MRRLALFAFCFLVATRLATAQTPAELAETAHLLHGLQNPDGGFGGGSKFPHSTSLEFLLGTWRRGGGADAQALTMVTHSLDCMAERGLYDHLAGGFFRYSVDGRWSIPHFEKMLYDNAQLLALYADAYAATGTPQYAGVASATAGSLATNPRNRPRASLSASAAPSARTVVERGRFERSAMSPNVAPRPRVASRRSTPVSGDPT